jgi:hypothetical protein
MAEESAKLRIPYVAAAQAQKHVTHNEGMTLLDTLVQLSVLDKDLSTPPGSPVEGDTYIVGASATGAWISWDKRIVRFIDGTWRSYLPGQGDGTGWLAYVIDESTLYVFTGTDWEQLFVAEGHSGVSSVNGEAGDVTLALDDLDDVTAPTPGDGHVLTFDMGLGDWIAAAPTGGDPVTLEPEGEWDNGTIYAKLDVVSYQGSSYVSRIDSNSGNQPDASPAEWMLLAEKGEPGAGAVDSVNGETGAVELDAADIAFNPSGLANTDADDVQEAIADHDTAIAAKTTGPGTVVDGHAALFDGATGKLLKSAGAAPALFGGNPQFASIELSHASQNTLTASGGVLSIEGVAVVRTSDVASTGAAGISEFATAAEFRAGSDTARSLVVDQVWSAPALQTLSSSSNSTAVDFSAFINASLALSENSTLANPTNEKVGQSGCIVVTASSSTRTLDKHADYKAANGVESFPLSILTTETVHIFYWIQAANVVVITSVARRTT